MLLRVLCICLLAYEVMGEDQLLAAWQGVHGGNKAMLCWKSMYYGDLEGNCEAVLLHPEWVMTRTTCAASKPNYKVTVFKTLDGRAASCNRFETESYLKLNGQRPPPHVRRSVSTHAPPRFISRECHVTLLALDHPFTWDTLDYLANVSAARSVVAKCQPWLDETIITYSSEQSDQMLKWKLDRLTLPRQGLFASPWKLFVFTILLPILAFLGLFVFVINFTGTPDDKIPYTNLNVDTKECNT